MWVNCYPVKTDLPVLLEAQTLLCLHTHSPQYRLEVLRNLHNFSSCILMWPFVHKGFLLTSLFKLPLSRCGMDHDIANVNEHPFQSKQKIVVFFWGGGGGSCWVQLKREYRRLFFVSYTTKAVNTNYTYLSELIVEYGPVIFFLTGWSRWPCGVRRGSAATWLLGSQVRISHRAWMFVLVFVVLQVAASAKRWSLVPTGCVCVCVSVSLFVIRFELLHRREKKYLTSIARSTSNINVMRRNFID